VDQGGTSVELSKRANSECFEKEDWKVRLARNEQSTGKQREGWKQIKSKKMRGNPYTDGNARVCVPDYRDTRERGIRQEKSETKGEEKRKFY